MNVFSVHRKIMAGIVGILYILGLLLIWKGICIVLRAKRSRYMASLSPTQDALLLYKLTNFVEFAFLSRNGTEFGLLKTLAIPSMTKLLHANKQFSPKFIVKRFDDTFILGEELVLNHVDSPRGSLAIRRLNFIHSHYNISNVDYLYVLSIFVLEPIRFTDKYGYRKWSEREKQAQFVVWRDIGTRMGIRDIPTTLEEMDRFSKQYEVQHMVYSDSNRKIVDVSLDLMLSKMPAFLRPFGRRVAFALFDDRLLKALDYPRQPWRLIWIVESVAKFCGGTFVGWFLPPRPMHWSTERIMLEEDDKDDKVYGLRYDLYRPSTYPNGYKIGELGNARAGQLGTTREGVLLCPFSLPLKKEV